MVMSSTALQSGLVGVTKREGYQVGKLELKRWVLRCFLKIN